MTAATRVRPGLEEEWEPGGRELEIQTQGHAEKVDVPHLPLNPNGCWGPVTAGRRVGAAGVSGSYPTNSTTAPAPDLDLDITLRDAYQAPINNRYLQNSHRKVRR